MARVDAIAEGVAAALEGAEVEDEKGKAFHRILRGKRNGIAIQVKVWHSNSLSGWVVEVPVKGPPILFSIHRDDERIVIECAPNAFESRMVDDELRKLFRNGPEIAVVADDGKIKGGDDGRIQYEASDVIETIDCVLAVKKRIEAIDLDVDGAEEIAILRADREKVWKRASWPARILMIVLGTIFVVAMLAGLRYGCLPS